MYVYVCVCICVCVSLHYSLSEDHVRLPFSAFGAILKIDMPRVTLITLIALIALITLLITLITLSHEYLYTSL